MLQKYADLTKFQFVVKTQFIKKKKIKIQSL